MAFAKFDNNHHRRMWALIGEATTGKSTFLAACRDPLVVIDPDGRFAEVAGQMQAADKAAYSLSDKPADHHDGLAIKAALDKNMPGATIGTIGLDSMTTLLEPLVARIMEEIERGQHKNKAAAWQPKARLLRVIIPAMTMWGTDVIFIYHEGEHRDEKGKKGTRHSVSALEEARMLYNLNARIRLGADKNGRYAEILWSRTGRTGKVYDEEGMWAGVPEKIDALIWENLTDEEKAIAAGKAPKVFADAQAAWAWGFAQGPFRDMQHAKNAYNKLKAEKKPKTAPKMRDLWVADVEARKERLEEGEPDEPESSERTTTPIGDMTEAEAEAEIKQRLAEPEKGGPPEDLDEALAKENADALGAEHQSLCPICESEDTKADGDDRVCRGCGTRYAKDRQILAYGPQWVIKKAGEDVYWFEDDEEWVSELGLASIYVEADHADTPLPDGGEWVEFDTADCVGG